MALENGESNGMVMPVAPMGYGYGGFGGGWGNGFGFGGDGTWLIVLFLFAMMGGWGGNGFGGGFGGNMMWPYFTAQNTDNVVQRGFDTSAISGQLSGIQSSISSGFAGAEVAECNRAMSAMQTAYNNQIANMNQQFATATELDNRLDTLAMSLQKCCCDNELAIANLQSVIQTENCADRAAVTDGVRDILTATQAQTQTILDKLCQQEIDALKEKNSTLQTQVQMQNLAASQAAQTAALVADNTAQTQALIQRIAPYPTPSFLVGNPYGYGNYYGNGYGWNNCGCGCGNNFGGIA